MKVLSAIAFGLVLVSCASKSEEGLLESISDKENDLREMSSSPNLDHDEYTKAENAYVLELINLYKEFPKSEKAPECLDKVHMVYSGIGNFELASNWADTLLLNYPKYPNRAIVLESQASTFDAIVEPRDSVKVRKYYSQLLREFPDLDPEKREGIEKRIKFNHLTFDQYIVQQMKDEASQ